MMNRAQSPTKYHAVCVGTMANSSSECSVALTTLLHTTSPVSVSAAASPESQYPPFPGSALVPSSVPPHTSTRSPKILRSLVQDEGPPPAMSRLHATVAVDSAG